MLIDEYRSIRQNVLDNLDRGDIMSVDAAEDTDSLSQQARNFKSNLNPIELSRFVKIFFEPLARKYH